MKRLIENMKKSKNIFPSDFFEDQIEYLSGVIGFYGFIALK